MRMKKTEKKSDQESDKPQEVGAKDTKENFLDKKLKEQRLLTSRAKSGEQQIKRERVIALSVRLNLVISFQEKQEKVQGIEDDSLLLLCFQENYKLSIHQSSGKPTFFELTRATRNLNLILALMFSILNCWPTRNLKGQLVITFT